MRRTTHPPDREEPRFDDPSVLDIEPADYVDQRIVVTPPQRPGIIRRLGRGLLRLLLLLLIIVGLSYLPESWGQQQHPNVQDALRICGDIRDLLYRVSLDLWHWLQAELPQWYQRLHALLPSALSDHLPKPETDLSI